MISPTPDERICAWCGVTFHRPRCTSATQWARRQYCSNACSRYAAIRHLRERNNVPLPPRADELCECGQRAASPVLVRQLSAEGRECYGWLALCADCRQLFDAVESTPITTRPEPHKQCRERPR